MLAGDVARRTSWPTATRRPRPTSAELVEPQRAAHPEPERRAAAVLDGSDVGQVVEPGWATRRRRGRRTGCPPGAPRRRASRSGSMPRQPWSATSTRGASRGLRWSQERLVARVTAPRLADQRPATRGRRARPAGAAPTRASRSSLTSATRRAASAATAAARPSAAGARCRRRRHAGRVGAPQVGDRPGEPVDAGRAAAAELAGVHPVVEPARVPASGSGQCSVSAGPGTWPLSRQLAPGVAHGLALARRGHPLPHRAPTRLAAAPRVPARRAAAAARGGG